MTMTASKLRENIYRVLDQVIETGQPVEITRKGVTLRIVAEKPVSKLSQLRKRSGYRGNPDEIIHIDWLKTWRKAQ